MNTHMPRHLFRPAEELNIFFLSIFALLITLHFSEVPRAGMVLSIYASLIGFQLLLPRINTEFAVMHSIRDIIFPVVSILTVFDSLGLIVHAVNPQDIDHLLIRLDYRLFGLHPTVALERVASPFLTDILQLAYTTYYFLPIAMGVTLWRQGRHDAFNYYLFLIMLCFYLSYVGYLLFPALGPRYAIAHLQTGELPGSAFSQSIQSLLNSLEGVKRDAFPSGHTGIAVTALVLAWRLDRRLFRIFLIPVVLLVAATVYCRYHYVVDVIGGLLLVVVTFIPGGVYYKFWTRRNGYPFPASERRHSD